MYDDEHDMDNVIPSVRQSQIVRRFHLDPALPQSPSLDPEVRYGPQFFERLMRQPSAHLTGLPGIMSSCTEWRPDTDWSSQPPPSLEALPPPSVLCRARRKKKKAESLEDRTGVSVRQHIEELRRKQSYIDQLKSMTWGGRRVLKARDEIPPERIGADLRETFQDFFETRRDNRRVEESQFSSLPSPHATPGVSYPWMSPSDGVTSSCCCPDPILEGWGADIFCQEE